MDKNKDYIKIETEIYFDKSGYYSRKDKLINISKELSEEFKDELRENDSISREYLEKLKQEVKNG